MKPTNSRDASEESNVRPDQKQSSDAPRSAKFAATQAAGDGIQGDVKKLDKTVEEKITANMADRK
jgi:hypothetical protein